MAWAPVQAPPPASAPQYAYGQGGAGGASAPAREILTAARTYFVRTDGSDSHTGLTNTAGGAFLTIQKAVDVCSLVDAGPFQLTVQVGDGTYTAGATIAQVRGSLPLIIKGNAATPANVHVNGTGTMFQVVAFAAWVQITDMKITATVLALTAAPAGILEFGNIVFGAAGNRHVNAQYRGHINVLSNYTIVGGGTVHVQASNGGTVRSVGRTITLTGTPAFSTAFAFSSQGDITINGCTFSGSATGPRYSAIMTGTIDSGGTTLPGSSAGTTATGGQFV